MGCTLSRRNVGKYLLRNALFFPSLTFYTTDFPLGVEYITFEIMTTATAPAKMFSYGNTRNERHRERTGWRIAFSL